ncbi:hypothetical protein ACJIZ3_016752 [Penstemon smallii]|uniref:Uncharacterized protein n=1 Tax=Penstemon smallii TaxID=265156 RepID=A0ABD3SUC4_9LAMI
MCGESQEKGLSIHAAADGGTTMLNCFVAYGNYFGIEISQSVSLSSILTGKPPFILAPMSDIYTGCSPPSGTTLNCLKTHATTLFICKKAISLPRQILGPA